MFLLLNQVFILFAIPSTYKIVVFAQSNTTSRNDERTAPTSIDCGVPPNHEDIQISGVPWHATVYRKTVAPYRQLCGGSLISATVVISAARCFWNEDKKLLESASQFAVAVGKTQRAWDSAEDKFLQKSDVKAIKLAPRFFGSLTHYGNDIALLNLTTPMRFTGYVMAVCLDLNTEELRLNSGTMGKISVWNVAQTNVSASHVIQMTDLAYITFEECLFKSTPDFVKYLIGDKMCAKLNGTKLCEGDMGTGLVFLDTFRGRQRYYLRGVLSVPSSHETCEEPPITGYTQISSHRKFIADNSVLNYELWRNQDCGILSEEEKVTGVLPWHAAIYTKNMKPYQVICGGCLISSRIVLSAASCFYKEPPSKVEVHPSTNSAVAVGKRYRPWDHPEDIYAQKSDVREIKTPSRYAAREANYQDDLALVTLMSEITFTRFVKPVCVNFDNDFDQLQISDNKIGKTDQCRSAGFSSSGRRKNLVT